MNPLLLIPAFIFGGAAIGPLLIALDRAHHRRNGLAYLPVGVFDGQPYNVVNAQRAAMVDDFRAYAAPKNLTPKPPVPSSIPTSMFHPADDMDVNQ